MLVARLGLEPRYPPPEGDVLPLDDLAMMAKFMPFLLKKLGHHINHQWNLTRRF